MFHLKRFICMIIISMSLIVIDSHCYASNGGATASTVAGANEVIPDVSNSDQSTPVINQAFQNLTAQVTTLQNSVTALQAAPAFSPTTSNALSGSVIQRVENETGAMSTASASIPDDDTIPQIGEGLQVLSQSITPSNASNILKITVVAHVASSNGIVIQAALFQDSTANAIASAHASSGSSGVSGVVTFTHTMTAGTTSATTFTVRVGGDGGTVTFNGEGGSRKFGGSLASSITIEEYKT